MQPAPALLARDIRCSYGERLAVRDVSLTARAGELFGILGPNGAGKSTLLKSFAGLVRHGGEVSLEGVSLTSLPRKELARRVAIVSQDPPADVPFTVLELVLMGRAPHLGRLALEGPRDRAIAEEAMRQADVAHLAARPIDQLSGGERRRVFLARALAQEPRVLLLDEPTAFLDLGHQARVMELAHGLARRGLCVLAVLHDPNLAVAWCDRVALLRSGELVAEGGPREVLTAERLADVYGAAMIELRGPKGEGPFFGFHR